MNKSTRSAKPRGFLLTVAAVAAAVGYTFGIFLPAQKSIAKMRTEISEKKQFIATAQQEAAACATLEEQLQIARQAVTEWRQHADGAQGTSLLGELALLAADAGVTLHRMVPQEPVRWEALQQQTLDLELSGDFVQIAAFLHAVERRPETIWPSNLELQSGSEDGATVECRLSLVVFTDNPEKSG